MEAGYDIRIIDASIAPDYKKRIMEEVKDALCLGISLVTGPMIRETVEVAKAIKKWDPDFPIILGGWHPSLLPTQTLEAPYVDIVVRAQGEESMLAVADRLRDDAPLDDVLGIGFKRRRQASFHSRATAEDGWTRCRPRLISWPTSMRTKRFAGAAGRCTFRVLHARLIVPTARMPECTDASGMLFRSSKWSKRRSN